MQAQYLAATQHCATCEYTKRKTGGGGSQALLARARMVSFLNVSLYLCPNSVLKYLNSEDIE